MDPRPLISVVDDDESVRESLPDLLREFGFDAQTFSSAEEFLASEAVADTNCLVLDVAMPGMTGPDLQRELKLREQSIPIVFITAHRDARARLRLIGQGAVDSLQAALHGQIRGGFDHATIESDHAPYNPGGALWKILPRNDATRDAIAGLLADWTNVPPRFQTQMARFHDSLMNGGPLPVMTADSRRALEIVTAFYHSSETHTEVRMPIGPDHPKYRSWLPASHGGQA